MKAELYDLLKSAGIKVTSNRLLVLRALADSGCTLSLGDLEVKIETLERSSILRVLTLFIDHHVVHTVEDGRGIVKYELCHTSTSHADNDMHVHFYCEKCRHTYCFENIAVPEIALPEAFTVRSVNYMLKGICPKCSETKSPVDKDC